MKKDINALALEYQKLDPIQKKTAEKDICDLLFPLVSSISSKYCFYSSVLFDDLNMEGILAGLEALRNYNPDTGTKFSTFAFSFISNKIKSFVQEQNVSGESKQYAAKELVLYKKNKKKLALELKREPTIEELSAMLNKKKSTILQYERMANKPMSFDDLSSQSEDDDTEISFEDSLIDQGEVEWQDDVARSEFKEDLDLFLSSIKKSDAEIIKMYIGYEYPRMNFDEIGKSLGISKATAFRKFNNYSEQLKNLLIS